MTAPDDGTMRTSKEVKLEAERDELRAALAAARGTILDLRSHLADLRAAQDFLRLSHQATATEAQKLQERFRTREDMLLAERSLLLETRDAQAARLSELEPLVQRVAVLTEERDALASRVGALDRLMRDLRWEDGPRSVRTVLPLARLARRLSGN